MRPTDMLATLTAQADSFDELTRRAVQELQQRWRSTYAAALKDRTGKWVIGGADWHVFESESIVHMRGARAEQAYVEHAAGVLLMIIERQRDLVGATCRFSTTPRIPYDSGCDVYISPRDFAWTAVFPHEVASGIGPFFSFADDNENR